MLEGIVCHQSHLLAVESFGVAKVYQCFVLVEVPQTELVDFTLEEVINLLLIGAFGHPAACTECDVGRSYATQVYSAEVGIELSVDEDLCASAGAAHGECHVVPVAIGPVAIGDSCHTIVAEGEQSVLETEAEEVARATHFGTVATSVRYDCCILLTLGSVEPQFHGVVHQVVYHGSTCSELHILVSAIE